MFTGIVQALGTIEFMQEIPAGRRLAVALGDLSGAAIAHGDSVCVSGVCLTALGPAPSPAADRQTQPGGIARFDVVTETLNRSTLASKRVGDRVNLELALRGDSFVGGHFVQGHVDAVGTVTTVREHALDWRITFAVPADIMACIVPKGSVAVDGVSMTVADVGADTFTLAVIPTTLEKTTLARLRSGDRVNVETDILARTVVHYLRRMGRGSPGISLQRLQELGMA